MGAQNEISQDDDRYWVYDEFIEACDYVFNISLIADDLVECKTVGELENIIYDQIELGVLPNPNRDRILQNALSLINRGLAGNMRAITKDDLDQPVAELCADISNKSWVRSYQIIQNVILDPLPKLTMKKWAWLLSLILWIGASVLAIWSGIAWSVLAGMLIGIFLAFLVAFIVHAMPRKRPKGDITLRDAIEQYIGNIERCHKGLSFVEVQYRVRRLYALWSEKTDADSINADTPFFGE